MRLDPQSTLPINGVNIEEDNKFCYLGIITTTNARTNNDVLFKVKKARYTVDNFCLFLNRTKLLRHLLKHLVLNINTGKS